MTHQVDFGSNVKAGSNDVEVGSNVEAGSNVESGSNVEAGSNDVEAGSNVEAVSSLSNVSFQSRKFILKNPQDFLQVFVLGLEHDDLSVGAVLRVFQSQSVLFVID